MNMRVFVTTAWPCFLLIFDREGELRKANPTDGTRGLKDLLTEEDFLPKSQQKQSES